MEYNDGSKEVMQRAWTEASDEALAEEREARPPVV